MYTGEDTQIREVTITAGNVLSIIPFTLALVLDFATRDAFLAMICTIVVGAVMLNGLIEVFYLEGAKTIIDNFSGDSPKDYTL